jgi:hypothetical protein
MKSLIVAGLLHWCLTTSAAECAPGGVGCLDESDETSLIQLSQKIVQPGRESNQKHAESKVARRNLMHTQAQKSDQEAASLLESQAKVGPFRTNLPIVAQSMNAVFGEGWSDPSGWYNNDVHSPSWFGGFSQGESTFDIDGEQAGADKNPMLPVQDGWYPQQVDPFHGITSETQPSEFFWESPSGDYDDAFQTFYPASGANIAGSRVKTGKFYSNLGEVLHQEYMQSAAALTARERKIPASWFDSMERQMDGYGRHDMPSPLSPKRFMTWKEKTINTTLTCKEPGCVAKINMSLPFDPKKERYTHCRASIFFHPTDFDDHYSSESVEYIQINHMRVGSNCRPNIQAGCSELAKRPLIPCVEDFEIDRLIDMFPQYGDKLAIEAKISNEVDECKYNGNLLSAVPTVTCLVDPLPPVIEEPPPKNLSRQAQCVASRPMQCTTRGCTAKTTIPIDADCVAGGKCKLTIMLSPTDFDNEDGSKEEIEFIKVGSAKVAGFMMPVAQHINPGSNPCKQEWQMAQVDGGHSADILKHGLTSYVQKFMNYSFPLISNLSIDVPLDGNVVLEGKITDAVDECAANGYLLDSIATVTCEKPEHKSHYIAPKKNSGH